MTRLTILLSLFLCLPAWGEEPEFGPGDEDCAEFTLENGHIALVCNGVSGEWRELLIPDTACYQHCIEWGEDPCCDCDGDICACIMPSTGCGAPCLKAIKVCGEVVTPEESDGE